MRAAATVVLLLASSIAHAAGLLLLDPAKGVIFPAAHAQDLLRQCSRDVPSSVSGAWTPDERQIRALEAKLPDALARTSGGPYVKLDTTIRQYAGIIVKGRKVIYVNAFPSSLLDEEAHDQSFTHIPPHDWHSIAVIICDGGAEFFGAEFDPVTGNFSDFSFNGVG
jgi:hypothetical protein